MFDFEGVRNKAKSLFKNEIGNSKSIQDEVKIFNERFPKHLEPLAKFDKLMEDYEKGVFTQSGNIGEFEESGTGVGGKLSYVEKGEYWTSNDLTKHDLRKTISTLTAGQINEWIMAKAGHRTGSKMHGQGEAFMEAGREYGVDPRYLAAHAAIESAWGTSPIVKDKNNYFGIEAYDGSAYDSARGFDSPKAGIKDGSKFISESYVHSSKYNQNTLYKMRFNNGVHQYATDPGWHTKIASTMKGFDAYTTPSEGGTPEGTGQTSKFQKPHRKAWYSVTSEFGYRIHPIKKTRRLHAGIDLSSGKHTPLYTIASGRVIQVAHDSGGWGNYLVISHGKAKGKEVFSLYAHMKDRSNLSVGQTVSESTQVGLEGTTGSSTGIHLHLEIREGSNGQAWNKAKPVNPRNYIDF